MPVFFLFSSYKPAIPSSRLPNKLCRYGRRRQKNNKNGTQSKKIEGKKTQVTRLDYNFTVICLDLYSLLRTTYTIGFSLKTIFTYPQASLARNERYRRLLLFFFLPPSLISPSRTHFYRRYSKIFFTPSSAASSTSLILLPSFFASSLQTSPHKRRLVFVRAYIFRDRYVYVKVQVNV